MLEDAMISLFHPPEEIAPLNRESPLCFKALLVAVPKRGFL
jgi:hypothetical protein